MTGQVPTTEQTRELSRELAEKGELPKFVEELLDRYMVYFFIFATYLLMLDSLPVDLHPMTQLGMSVAALNRGSKFQSAYERGIKKTEYWTYALEDSLDLIAKLPTIAARIYRNIYRPGEVIAPIDKDLDLVGECGELRSSSLLKGRIQAIIPTCLDMGKIKH